MAVSSGISVNSNMPGDFFSSFLDSIEAVLDGIDFDLWSMRVEPRQVDCARDGSVASSRFEVNAVCKSLMKGLSTGTHCTMIVPETSAEYHICETASRHISVWDLVSVYHLQWLICYVAFSENTILESEAPTPPIVHMHKRCVFPPSSYCCDDSDPAIQHYQLGCTSSHGAL